MKVEFVGSKLTKRQEVTLRLHLAFASEIGEFKCSNAESVPAEIARSLGWFVTTRDLEPDVVIATDEGAATHTARKLGLRVIVLEAFKPEPAGEKPNQGN